MSDITFTLDSSRIQGASSHDFTVSLPAPIDLHELQHEVALRSISLWNTWYNISAALGNNIFTYSDGVDTKNITIPDGNYNIESLEAAIHEGMKANGDFTADPITGGESYNINLKANYSTLKIELVLTGGFEVDFTTSKLNELLGFESEVVTATKYGANKANMTNGVNEFYIHCSLVNASMYVNASKSDIIHKLVPAVPPGGLIQEDVDNPLYLAIADNRYIDEIRMYITDQRGRSIDLNGSTVCATIHIKPRQLLKIEPSRR